MQIQSDDGSGSTKEVDKVGANAAALYGPDGEFVGSYRKTNLYTTDMTWARAGPYSLFMFRSLQCKG